MLSSRYNIDSIKEGLDTDLDARLSMWERPLIVRADTARKALFTKLNRSGGMDGAGKKSRLTRRGLMTRGNSFGGYTFGQRVVVKIRYVKHKQKAAQAGTATGKGRAAGGGASALKSHVRYISRGAAGKDGTQAVLFNEQGEGVEAGAFVTVCERDRHHWRFIISPENGHQIEDFQGYVREIMKKVEGDLGTKLEWVSAVHYDTDDIHAHVIVRGKNDRGQDLVIGQDYIKEGIRRRAQEVATALIGERSLDEIKKSLEAEVDALRVTSLDRFIERQATEDRKVDVRKKVNFDKSLFYEGLIKGRLRYLEKAGLATEEPPGVYQLKDGYKEALAQAGQKNDVIRQLYKRGVTAGMDDLALYSLKGGEGRVVEGRVVDKGIHDELTERQYIVVRDAAEKLHYVPVFDSVPYHQAKTGSLVRVSPGDQSTGKADHNIRKMAEQNAGIYDPAHHRAYIDRHMTFIAPEDRPKYLESHQVRLSTLERNGIVQPLGDGRYQVPADVVERGAVVTQEINAKERKRFYPKLDVLSVQPPERIVTASRRTWLDTELFKQGRGMPSMTVYDAATARALEDRKKWLVEKDLSVIQSNGTFALRDGALKRLDRMEVYAAGEKLAQKLALRFDDKMVKEGEAMLYQGSVQLATGTWAVVSKGRALYLAPVEAKPQAEYGQQVKFTQLESGKYEAQAVQERARTKDRGPEREL